MVKLLVVGNSFPEGWQHGFNISSDELSTCNTQHPYPASSLHQVGAEFQVIVDLTPTLHNDKAHELPCILAADPTKNPCQME